MKHSALQALAMVCCSAAAYSSMNPEFAQTFIQNVPYAAVGFDLAPTRATSAVYLSNGTLVDVVSIEGNVDYKDWMQQALLSSQPVTRRSFPAQLLSARFAAVARFLTSTLPGLYTSQGTVDQTSAQDTSPLVSILSELHGQTAASTGLIINDVVVSYPTFMTPRQQLSILDATKLANLSDIGCHPSSDSAIVAAVASQFDCPLPPPDLKDGTTYARQGGAFRIVSLDLSDFALTARLWHSWDAGTQRRQDWFAQSLPSHGLAHEGTADNAIFWTDFTICLQKLLRIPEQRLGIRVQPDGFYTDAQVELVVLTGAFNISSKQLLGTVLRVLSNTASTYSTPELRSHLRSLLDNDEDHRPSEGGCTVDPVFAAARGAALYQHMKTSNMCSMPCEALEEDNLRKCRGVLDARDIFFKLDRKLQSTRAALRR